MTRAKKVIRDFYKYFTMDSFELYQHMSELMSYAGYEEQTHGTNYNDVLYLYGKGDVPIMIVAHIDTVHRKLNKNKDMQFNSIALTLTSKCGLGADDRAGIWAMEEIIKSGRKPHILITNFEESGGAGANAAALALVPEVNVIIELDRKGSNDAVYYQNDDKAIRKWVKQFGFEEAHGSFSDISILCPSWGISGVNLSIGYYHQHSTDEYLKINEFYDVVRRVKKMIDHCPKELYKYKEKVYSWGGRGYYDNYYSRHTNRNLSTSGSKWCTKCGTLLYGGKCPMCDDTITIPSVKTEPIYCPKCGHSLTLAGEHLDYDVYDCDNLKCGKWYKKFPGDERLWTYQFNQEEQCWKYTPVGSITPEAALELALKLALEEDKGGDN